MRFLRITARRDGFRRAGISHPASPVLHPAERFSPREVDALFAEPMLIVDEIDDQAVQTTPAPEVAAAIAAPGDAVDQSRIDAPAAGLDARAADAPGGGDLNAQNTPEGRSGTAREAPGTGSGSEGLVQDSEGPQAAAPHAEGTPPAADAARTEPPAAAPNPKGAKGKEK